jgi:hypothetical protein
MRNGLCVADVGWDDKDVDAAVDGMDLLCYASKCIC